MGEILSGVGVWRLFVCGEPNLCAVRGICVRRSGFVCGDVILCAQIQFYVRSDNFLLIKIKKHLLE